MELLGQHGVDVLVARRARDAHAAVAPGATRHASERVDVQPVADVLVGRDRVADAVRPFVAALPLQRGIGAVDDRDRKAASRLENAADPPAAENGVDDVE